ncbi:hypothetical protein BLNAU_8299 [Blattamonas nauphoetae]|uniref:Uncharacterized protein n=1 Tax=Blattamonas nauphoetae TaxID=2049346 RepID=A0ABQ9XYX4_9EUKA|nr:hypothetical protein BLNAU_8299 [Blattamonas nauphoetae]
MLSFGSSSGSFSSDSLWATLLEWSEPMSSSSNRCCATGVAFVFALEREKGDGACGNCFDFPRWNWKPAPDMARVCGSDVLVPYVCSIFFFLHSASFVLTNSSFSDSRRVLLDLYNFLFSSSSAFFASSAANTSDGDGSYIDWKLRVGALEFFPSPTASKRSSSSVTSSILRSSKRSLACASSSSTVMCFISLGLSLVSFFSCCFSSFFSSDLSFDEECKFSSFLSSSSSSFSSSFFSSSTLAGFAGFSKMSRLSSASSSTNPPICSALNICSSPFSFSFSFFLSVWSVSAFASAFAFSLAISSCISF